MIASRRGFLTGLGATLAAPAIVHAGNLMPIRGIVMDVPRLVTMPVSIMEEWVVADLQLVLLSIMRADGYVINRDELKFFLVEAG